MRRYIALAAWLVLFVPILPLMLLELIATGARAILDSAPALSIEDWYDRRGAALVRWSRRC